MIEAWKSRSVPNWMARSGNNPTLMLQSFEAGSGVGFAMMSAAIGLQWVWDLGKLIFGAIDVNARWMTKLHNLRLGVRREK